MGKRKNNNSATLWKPQKDMDVSLFKAAFTSFTYERHTHEEYAIGIIDAGVQKFSHKGSGYEAPPMSIIAVNPDEVHDGESLLEDGYIYRMMYVGLPYLQDLFGTDFERKGFHAFKSPVVSNPEIACRMGRAFDCIEAGQGDMDELLSPILYDLFSRHAAPCPPAALGGDNSDGIRRAACYIRDNGNTQIKLDQLADMAGLSKFHFIRMFKQKMGLTPHAYLMRQRIILARKAMEDGDSPTDAAFKAGFSDQSHLTRRFKAVYGVTPGSFVKALH